MKTSRVAVLVALVAAVARSSSAPFAGAQEDERLSVRSVDGTDPADVVVEFVFAGDRADLADLTIRENGEVVENTPPELIQESQQLVGTVLVIDTSLSMEDDGKLVAAKNAATEYVAAKGPNDRIAIVSFDSVATVDQEFTDDQAALTAAIEGLELASETALYDSVETAVTLFDGTELQPNIVLLSDGEDTSSEISAGAARTFVADSEALLYAVALGEGAANIEGFGDLATASGGRLLRAENAEDLGAVYDDIQRSLQSQYRTTFASQATEDGLAQLTISAAGQRATVDFSPGSRTTGSQLEVTDSGTPAGPAFLRGTAGLYLIGLLVLAAVGGLVYAVVTAFVSERNTLDSVLQPYADGFVAAEAEEDDSLAQTPLLRRAVEMTGDFAERRGVLERVEASLERANLPLRAAEALFFFGAVVVVVTLLALVITQNLLVTAVIGVLAALAGPGILNFLASRRRKQFHAQLPDMLQLLSGTLRAGYSLMQGVEAVSQEISEPMAREIQRVVTEARLGRELEESLDAVAERMDSDDFAWAVMAIRIQREVGGNLAELLLTVAQTMTARERLRRDVERTHRRGQDQRHRAGHPAGRPGLRHVRHQPRIHRDAVAGRCGPARIGRRHSAHGRGFLLDEEDDRDRHLTCN